MGTIALLARRTARRQRLQLATTLLLVGLAALMINLGVICATDYPAAQKTAADRLATSDLQAHGDDLTAMASLAAHLRADDRVARVDERPAREAWASYDFNGTKTASDVVLFVPQQGADLARTRIVEEGSERYAEPIWLPYVYKQGGGYRVGDTFTLTICQTPHTYRVQGFFEHFYFGLMTMGFSGFAVTQAQLDAFDAATPGAGQPAAAQVLEVRLTDAARASDSTAGDVGAVAQDAVKAEYSAKGLEPPMLWTDPYSLAHSAIMAGPNIYAVSLVAFSLLIALVVVVVIRFVIRTAVLQDMTAIGTLAATGVTSAQALWGIALPMVLTALLGALAGVAASYAVLPVLTASLTAQTGLLWSPAFSGAGMLTAVALLTLAVLVTALLAARGVRRVTPVQAVRGGGEAHSFRRTVLPLDRARGPLDLLLGMKQGAAQLSQNVLVAVVVALVTFAGMFSTALYTDVLGSRQAFTRIMVGDLAPAQVQVKDLDRSRVRDGGVRDELLREVEGTPGVSKAFYIDNRVAASAGRQVMAYVTQDFSRQDYSSIYEGREPRHADEIALGGRLAEASGKRIGDTYTLEIGGTKRDYLVTGLLSTVQYAGNRADLTTDGYRRLVPAYQPDYLSVYLTPGTSVDDLKRALPAAANDKIATVSDTAEVLSSQIDIYIQMCGYLATGILIGTALVICLVVGLVTATMIVRTRRSFGVRKALGFTSRQLITQTVMTYLPVVAVGALLGVGLGFLLVEPALVAMLSTVGVMSLDLHVRPLVTGGLWLGVVALAGVLVAAQAQRVRGITAYSLFQDA